jgi:hypothetical protein
VGFFLVSHYPAIKRYSFIADTEQLIVGQAVVSGVVHPVLLSCLTLVSAVLADSCSAFWRRRISRNFFARSVALADVYLKRWSRMLVGRSVAGFLGMFILSKGEGSYHRMQGDARGLRLLARLCTLAQDAGALYYPAMTELRLRLSIGALQSIAAGEELVFTLPEEGIEVSIACDESAMAAFRSAVERAMLEFLPAAPGQH